MQRSILVAAAGLAALSFLSATPAIAQRIDMDLLAGMKARTIGPATMSGRIAAIDAVVDDPRVIYVGAATGGLWKSTNAGLNWEPLFDDQEVLAIGAVAIYQASPEIVWVGTGEGNPRNSASVGNGVYRSVDGGKTWTHLGLEKSERIARICLHPTNPEVAYVAAMGTTWGENSQRGVFKTTNGGKTWEHVLQVDNRTGCADLVMDPTHPDKLFAAMWDHRRWPWFFRSGGPGSGLHVTRDGGDTWKRLTEDDGLPKGDLGRIGLAIAPSDPRVVYAYVEAKENAVCRSDDGGTKWEIVGTGDAIGNRPFYYADITVDPKDPNRVYSLWSLVSVSNDGGKNFEVLVPFAEVHPDHHALWIHPDRPEYLINGNDGGIAISHDHGHTWRYVRNLPLAQFYHVRYDMEHPYNIYGGLQDNGSWKGPSSVWENAGIRNHHWQEVAFGDGFDTVPDPRDPSQGYAMSQEGYLYRWNSQTGERKVIRPIGPTGPDGKPVELRFNWNAGIALDPKNPDTVYFGSQYVHRSRDRGETWDIISGDLTTNNPEWQKQDQSGGLTLDVTGAENFVSIVALACSEIDSSIIWVGTDDGRVHVTQNSGATWTSVEGNLTGVPDNTWIPHIAPSQHDAATAYVVFDDHRRANWTPYVYRTQDFGRTWTSLAQPEISGYCLAIVEDPVDPNLLFLGTEFGLYLSCDGGSRWGRWSHAIPHGSVMDLAIHPREHDLIVATHGRAAYIIDDLRPLRGLSAEILQKPLHLFELPPAQQYWVGQTGSSRFAGHGEFHGENKPYGASITFSLNVEGLSHPDDEKERERKQKERAAKRPTADASDEAPDEEESKKDKPKKAEIEIASLDGTVLRTFKAPVKLGVNRAVWNLRQKGFRRPQSPEDEMKDEDEEPEGPQVLPGQYRVTVRYQGHTATGTVEVKADPRLPIPREAREAKLQAELQVGRAIETVALALDRIKETRADLDVVLSKERMQNRAVGRKSDSDKELSDAVEKLQKELMRLEKLFRHPPDTKGIPADDHVMSLLGQAGWFLGSSWDAPTQAQLTLIDRGAAKLDDAIGQLNEFFEQELPPLREIVERKLIRLLPNRDALSLPR